MLVSDVARRVGRTFGDTDQVMITSADWYDFINEACLDIVKRTDCLQESNSAAASTYPLDFPTDCLKVKSITYGQVPLKRIEIEQLEAFGQDLTERSTPQFYYIGNDGNTTASINLFPLQPSGDTTTVVLWYVQTPTAVTALANTIPTPVMFDNEIVAYVTAKAHEMNQNASAEQNSMAKYQERMAVATDDSFVGDDTYLVVRDDPGEIW